MSWHLPLDGKDGHRQQSRGQAVSSCRGKKHRIEHVFSAFFLVEFSIFFFQMYSGCIYFKCLIFVVTSLIVETKLSSGLQSILLVSGTDGAAVTHLIKFPIIYWCSYLYFLLKPWHKLCVLSVVTSQLLTSSIWVERVKLLRYLSVNKIFGFKDIWHEH